MALYVMTGFDREDGLDVRKATRPAHLEWVDGLGARVKFAGPMLSEDGGTPAGSLIVVEAENLAAAQALFEEDPYARAGLWARLEVRPIVQVKP
ncbi:MAG: YciI family protein [Hyphomonadaceae bacterium]